MKIDFQGETYYIRFKHSIENRATLCSIWRGNGKMLERDVSLASLIPGGHAEPPVFDGEPTVKALAECSAKDQFDRKIGRAISLGRAAKTLWHDKPIERIAFLTAIRLAQAARK